MQGPLHLLASSHVEIHSDLQGRGPMCGKHTQRGPSDLGRGRARVTSFRVSTTAGPEVAGELGLPGLTWPLVVTFSVAFLPGQE